MFYFIISTIAFISVPILIKLDIHNIIYNNLEYKYSRWKQLNTLVSTKHNKKCMIILVSIKMIIKILYLNLIQYLNNSVKKIGKNMYEVSYVVNGKMYKMIVSPNRGPAQILQVTDQNNNDITDKILSYLGPRDDWHNTKFTPNFWGYDSLTFQMYDGREVFINKDDFLS
jgi:hypothetical protein